MIAELAPLSVPPSTLQCLDKTHRKEVVEIRTIPSCIVKTMALIYIYPTRITCTWTSPKSTSSLIKAYTCKYSQAGGNTLATVEETLHNPRCRRPHNCNNSQVATDRDGSSNPKHREPQKTSKGSCEGVAPLVQALEMLFW